MGYYSDFAVSVIRKEESVTPEQLNACLTEVNENAQEASCEKFCDTPPFGMDYGISFNAKWYDRETDLPAITAKYPGIVIQVDCVGEDGEMWRERYANGKGESHNAIITYPEFNIK